MDFSISTESTEMETVREIILEPSSPCLYAWDQHIPSVFQGESSLQLPLVLGLASLSCFCLLLFVLSIVNFQMIFQLSDKDFT